MAATTAAKVQVAALRVSVQALVQEQGDLRIQVNATVDRNEFLEGSFAEQNRKHHQNTHWTHQFLPRHQQKFASVEQQPRDTHSQQALVAKEVKNSRTTCHWPTSESYKPVCPMIAALLDWELSILI